MSEMVKRISEVLQAELSDCDMGIDRDWDGAARAVLRVLRNPTGEMLRAGCAKAAEEQCRPVAIHLMDACNLYQAMIDAALEEGQTP